MMLKNHLRTEMHKQIVWASKMTPKIKSTSLYTVQVQKMKWVDSIRQRALKTGA